jgi:hypothetical protein
MGDAVPSPPPLDIDSQLDEALRELEDEIASAKEILVRIPSPSALPAPEADAGSSPAADGRPRDGA